MKYSYYPGCSLERNARAYHDSTIAIAPYLNMELMEIDDWNCCGATEYFSINGLGAYALVARNLAIAASQPENGQLVAPCSACFLNLTKTDHHMSESSDLNDKVNQALSAGGLSYNPGSVQTRHLLDVIVSDVGIEAIVAKVTKHLFNLRVAPYYGCLVARPGYVGGFDDSEYPTTLDKLLKALGAEVVDFPMKTHCCGGHMTQISSETALELINQLLMNAEEHHSDAIVTLCPMCQLNLDAYQNSVNKRFGTDYNIPVLYFTQLLGLAFGVPADMLGFGSEFVDVKTALDKILDEPPKKEKIKRPSKEALPMPSMPKEG
jgi:heterodisulfide reductase subunit B